MKNKIPKIIFIISFFPYLLAIIIGIIESFSGISFFAGTTIYGIEAFVVATLFTLYSLVYIPVIPVCIIYQLSYIFRNKVKKFKNIKINKYITICCIIGIIIILAIVCYTYSFEIGQVIERIGAKQMANNSEEKIAFRKNNIMSGGIFNMHEYEYNHIFIDYDKMEVGMLLYPGYDQFWKVKLQNISKDSLEYKHIINDYNMQANIPLNSPGKRLISFYKDKPLIHCTIAFLLICEDGTIYFADNIKEKDTGSARFTGLHWSEFFVGENVKFGK